MDSKWNSRKLAALLITVFTNLLVWAKVDSEIAQTFAAAAVNAVSLGYIIVQGWIDARAEDSGRRS